MLGLVVSVWLSVKETAKLFSRMTVPFYTPTVHHLKKIFYLFIHETHTHTHTHTQRQRHRQREEQAPCREPDMGLDPQTQDHTLSQRQMLNR